MPAEKIVIVLFERRASEQRATSEHASKGERASKQKQAKKSEPKRASTNKRAKKEASKGKISEKSSQSPLTRLSSSRVCSCTPAPSLPAHFSAPVCAICRKESRGMDR
jgi:hypothetical protein